MRKYLKYIFYPIREHYIKFFVYLFFEFFDGFQSVFMIVISTNVISAIEQGNEIMLYNRTIIFLILVIFLTIQYIFSDPLYSLLYRDIEFELTKIFLGGYIDLDNTEIEQIGTGRMNNIIFKGIESYNQTIKLMMNVIVEVFAILYVFVLIFMRLDNIYYFIVFVFLFLGLIFLFGKGLEAIFKRRKISKQLSIENDRQKIKILMSKFEIMQNGKIKQELENIYDIEKKLKKLWFWGNLIKNLRQISSQWILWGFRIFVFLVIGLGIIRGRYDIASFALFIRLLETTGKYAWSIRGYMRDILFHFTNIEKLIDIFESIPKHENKEKFPDFVFHKGDIEIKELSFSYGDNKNIFNKFDLKISGGKKSSFVGPSGGGKSTLLKLIIGYMKAKSGKIIIDGQDISKVNFEKLYKEIGYLSQDPSVFDGTIYENLIYALNEKPSKSELEKVIKSARCNFIFDFKNGIHTEIGERGIKLSGGQKQRLAIAKIMLKNPEIILLDEPTSALDSENEEHIGEALDNLFKGNTVIIIAHRLQTVKKSDMIFYIENGKIIEKGNHKELIKKKGKYYKMIELQSGF